MRTPHCLAFVTALSASIAPLDAQPANQWRPIYRDATAQFFIDPATLDRQGQADEFTVMGRAVFHEPQEGIASLTTRLLYDCSSQTMVVLHLTQFRPDGSVALDVDTLWDEQAPDRVEPGSANEVVLNEYCSR